MAPLRLWRTCPRRGNRQVTPIRKPCFAAPGSDKLMSAMGAEGFEPSKAYANGFTARPLWPTRAHAPRMNPDREEPAGYHPAIPCSSYSNPPPMTSFHNPKMGRGVQATSGTCVRVARTSVGHGHDRGQSDLKESQAPPASPNSSLSVAKAGCAKKKEPVPRAARPPQRPTGDTLFVCDSVLLLLALMIAGNLTMPPHDFRRRWPDGGHLASAALEGRPAGAESAQRDAHAD